MSDLQINKWEIKVRQVRWRQVAQTFLRRLPAWLVGAMMLAAAIYVAQPYLPWVMTWWLPIAVLAPTSVAAALAWAIWRHPSTTDSALALDDAFGLQERVTTVVSLNANQRVSAAGQALIADTAQHIDKVDVQSRFPVQLTRDALCVPAMLLGFALLVWLYNPTGAGNANAGDGERALQIEKPPPEQAKEVKQRTDERKKRAKEIGSDKLDQLLADLEKITDNVEKAENKAEMQQPAIQEMTKLAENIKKRQEELGKNKDIQKKLREDQELKKAEEGPAKNLQEALAKGDMQQAIHELNKLAQDMKSGQMTDAEKKALAKELADLKQKLKNIAEQKQRRENLAKSNADPETKAKEQAQIDKDSANLQDLNELAEQLSDEALKDLAEGNSEQLLKKFKGALAMLEDLEKSDDEMSELIEMLADIDELKQCLG
jgi:membrane protein implicated in regulation of membrane protease activity